VGARQDHRGVRHALSAGATDPAAALRAARAGDAADVATLLTQLGYPCDEPGAAERIARSAIEPGQDLIVCEHAGSVVGLLVLDLRYYVPAGRPSARIAALVVRDDQRGSGIGAELVREAERRALAAGAMRIEVTSAQHRTGAHAFYQHQGYEPRGPRFVKFTP